LVILFALLGGYLLLTPLLGVTITPHTATAAIFNFSPLQNIEGGYRALTNNSGIDLASFVFLLASLVVGTGLNAIVKRKKIVQ